MDIEEIKELLQAVTESEISELEIQEGDRKIRIKRAPDADAARPPYVVVTGGLGAAAQADPAAQVAAPPASRPLEEPSGEEEDLVLVSSPMVGTFYESPSPGAPSFVEVGDRVEPGQVLCIIEAMKLMNEIEAETAGVIAKRFVANSHR